MMRSIINKLTKLLNHTIRKAELSTLVFILSTRKQWEVSGQKKSILIRFLLTALNSGKCFFKELDTVAVGLQDLCYAGIMVMFRPFHEMNEAWFWWGKKERFVELWRTM